MKYQERPPLHEGTGVLDGGQEPLAVRASKKLRAEELLLTSLGATVLRK